MILLSGVIPDEDSSLRTTQPVAVRWITVFGGLVLFLGSFAIMARQKWAMWICLMPCLLLLAQSPLLMLALTEFRSRGNVNSAIHCTLLLADVVFGLVTAGLTCLTLWGMRRR
jgi:hypothetical protein